MYSLSVVGRRFFVSAASPVLRAGHNKWSKVKHIKAVQDAKKSTKYTKITKEIAAAVKAKGDDPNINSALAQALMRAKDVSLPKVNVENAIKKGLGKTDEGNMEAIVYEGVGPKGIAIIVEALTEKKTRTVSNIRTIFSKNGGVFGTSGQVSWMFNRRGVIVISSSDEGVTNDTMFESALDSGALDAEVLEDRLLEVQCEPAQVMVVRSALEKLGYKIESMETLFVPHTFGNLLTEDVRQELDNLVELLENDDDVVRVAHNHPDHELPDDP